MRLSELHPNQVEVVGHPAPSAERLKLSDLHPDQVEHVAVPPHDVGQLEALGRGAAQGATLGFADEIAGAGEAASDKVGDLIHGTDRGSLADRYRTHRDESRQNFDAAREAHPYTSMAGELGGGLATAFVPGVGISKGAGALMNIGKAAAIGGTAGLGSSKADVTQGDVLGASYDAGKGAALGAGTGAALEGVLRSPELLKDGARALTKAHLRPTTAVAQKIGEDGLNGAADETLRSGSLNWFGKAKDTAKNLRDKLDEVGEAKSDIMNASPAKIDPWQVAQRFDSEVIEPLRRGKTANREAIQALEKERDAFLTDHYSKPLSLAESEGEKSGYAATKGSTTTDGGLRGFGRILKEEGSRAANDPAFDGANAAYRNLKNASKMADRTGAQQHGGLAERAVDAGVGAEAFNLMHHGRGWLGAGLGVARAVTKGRLSSTGALALDGAANGLAKGSEWLGRAGSAVAGVARQGLEGPVQAVPAFSRAADSSASRVLAKVQGTKWEQPLQQAAQRGDDAWASSYFMLSSRDPEFRAHMESDDDQ